MEPQPPLIPVKPYPPRLGDSSPRSPFSIDFPSDAAGEGEGDDDDQSDEVEEDEVKYGIQRKGNLNQGSKIPKRSNGTSTGQSQTQSNKRISVRQSRPSRATPQQLGDVGTTGDAVAAFRSSALYNSNNDGEENDESEMFDDRTRESVYSTVSSANGWGPDGSHNSAVVTTASAMSIKRAVASPRPLVTSSAPSQPRSERVDKGTNVVTSSRRKSKERNRVSSVADSDTSSSRRIVSSAGAGKSAIPRLSIASSSGSSKPKAATEDVRKQGLVPSKAPLRTAVSRATSKQDETLPSITTRDGDQLSSSRPRIEMADAENLSPAKTTLAKKKLAIDTSREAIDQGNLNRPYSSKGEGQGQSKDKLSPYSSAGGRDVNFSSAFPRSPLSLSPLGSAGEGESRRKESISTSLDPLSGQWGQSMSAHPLDDTFLALSPSSSSYMMANQPPNVSTVSPSLSPSQTFSTTTREITGPNGRRISTSSSAAPATHNRFASTVSSVGPMSTLSTSHSQTPLRPPDKEAYLTQLLASLALIDSQAYEPLNSIEEVEACKRELAQLERRIVDLTHKLKVEMRVRDAADKLRRAAPGRRTGGGSKGHGRTTSTTSAKRLSSSSSATNHGDRSISSLEEFQRAEADVAAATKKVDMVSKQLLELKDRANVVRRRLLEHQTRVLALRIGTLEAEADQLASNAAADAVRMRETDEENSKVGANLAIEEVEALRLKVDRAESRLARERKDREEEVESWRRKHEQVEKQRSMDRQSSESSQAAMKRQMEQVHQQALEEERRKRREVEGALGEHQSTMVQRDGQSTEMQRQLRDLEIEMNAERQLMADRAELFQAFEKRLDDAERRLRKEDERCAKLLGKVEGREEMDDLLAQIKAGYAGASSKKDRTAGQDIDGLLDSLTTHISDMADEVSRANVQFRRRRKMLQRGEGGEPFKEDEEDEEEEEKEEEEAEVEGSRGGHDDRSQKRVHGAKLKESKNTIRELELALQTTERELESWRSEAESTKRHLTAIQRNSAISAAGSTATHGARSTMTPTDWRASTMRPGAGANRAVAELEAKLALLERKNSSLEEELSEARLAATFASNSFDSQPLSSTTRSTNSERDSPVKTAGSDGGARVSLFTFQRQVELSKAMIAGLLDILPEQLHLPSAPSAVELEMLHTAFDQRSSVLPSPLLSGAFKSNVAVDESSARAVLERARNVVSATRTALTKCLSLQQLQESMEQDAQSAEERCATLERAMEEMREGQSNQTQLVEAAKARERRLEAVVGDLRAVLEKSTRDDIGMLSSSMTSATPSKRKNAAFRSNQRAFVGTFGGTSQARSGGFAPASYKSTSSFVVSNISPSRSGDESTATTSVGDSSPLRKEKKLPLTPQATQQNLHPSPSNSSKGTTPRTITLGMDFKGMVNRVRELESELANVKVWKRQADMSTELERRWEDSKRDMEEMKKEFEEIREVESIQRVQLLEELTTLTSELSGARADLRAEQRKQSLAKG